MTPSGIFCASIQELEKQFGRTDPTAGLTRKNREALHAYQRMKAAGELNLRSASLPARKKKMHSGRTSQGAEGLVRSDSPISVRTNNMHSDRAFHRTDGSTGGINGTNGKSVPQ